MQIEVESLGLTQAGSEALGGILQGSVYYDCDSVCAKRQTVVAIVAFLIALDGVVALDIGAVEVHHGANEGFAGRIFDQAFNSRCLRERREREQQKCECGKCE